MARIKQTSVRPRLLRCNGKIPRMITVISQITGEFMKMNSSVLKKPSKEDRMQIVKRNRKVLETIIVQFRFYHHIHRYVKVIERVGIDFSDMVQSYIRTMLVTSPRNDPAYYEFVERLAVPMSAACDSMRESMCVQDEMQLGSVCSRSSENILRLHNNMLRMMQE